MAFALKEVRHISRDLRILFLVTISPALLGLTFSYVFSFNVDRAALVVLDLDKSQSSRQFVDTLTADGDFWVWGRAHDYAQVDAALLQGGVDVALIVPPGFSANIQRGRSAQVQAILDGSDTIAARTNAGYLEARVADAGGSLRLRGAPPIAAPLQVQTHSWYNPTLDSVTSMVPAMVAIVLQMPALALALALSRERESGSFESLVTTPMRGVEYLLGKLSAYVGSGLLSSLPTLAVAVYWFRVPFRGSLATFMLLGTFFFIASMGLGLLVGNLVSSQQTAMFIMMLVIFIPSFFLSGLLLPVDRTSRLAQITAEALPATHFIAICRSLFLKGSSFADLQPASLRLLGMGGALFALNLLLFKKRA